MKKHNSVCPVAASLDVFGDRWSLLIVRDLFAGKTAYSDFLDSPEKISTNILSNRLKALESHGIITSMTKSERTGKPIYSLTAKGQSLYPVIYAIADWALENIAGTKSVIQVSGR